VVLAVVARFMMRAPLDVVIVCWNAGTSLRECLRSLETAQAEGAAIGRVVVVDNGSSTDPAEPGVSALPIQLIRNARNVGFAAACNQAAAESRADYLLFLNPDVVLGPGGLTASVSLLEDERHRDTGVVGIQLVDERGTVTRTCARRPRRLTFLASLLRLHRLWPGPLTSYLMLEWDHAASRDVDHVTGAFYLVRRAVFVALGGFDERFFVYFEDLDLSMRVRQAGWTIRYVAGVRARHRGGWASGDWRSVRLYHDWRSRAAFSRKHFGRATALATVILTALVDPLVRVAAGIARGAPGDVRDSLDVCLRLITGRPPRETRDRESPV
jgi:GT2 family glycosyltransferase